MLFRSDFYRHKIIKGKWTVLHPIRLLHSILISAPGPGERRGGLFPGRLQARNLLCTGYPTISCIMGNKRDTLCTTHCGCDFCHNNSVDGCSTPSRTGKICRSYTNKRTIETAQKPVAEPQSCAKKKVGMYICKRNSKNRDGYTVLPVAVRHATKCMRTLSLSTSHCSVRNVEKKS